MANKWEVSGTTATYKNDAGKTLTTITGLTSGLTASGGQISGITVTEEGTIKLAQYVLPVGKDPATVKLRNEKGSKYTLALVDGVQSVARTGDITPKLTENKGKATATLTFTSNLTQGYTLTDATTISYTPAKTDQVVATVNNLKTDLKVTDDKKIVATVETVDATTGETTTSEVEAVKYDAETGLITLTGNAVSGNNVTLTTTAYSPYSALTLDGTVPAPEFTGTGWEYSGGTAVYKGTVAEAGYRLSLDGKTLVYTAASAANAREANLITVSGLSPETTFDNVDLSKKTATNNVTFTLSASDLAGKNVTVSGIGYKLALDTTAEPVSTSEVAERDIWYLPLNGTTATYKRIKPEYYTLNATPNGITYTKQADVKTYATVSGLKKFTADDMEDIEEAINIDGSVIKIGDNALGEANIALKNSADSNYTLALADPATNAPAATNLTWTAKGTTATLSGETEGGYASTSDTLITYVKPTATNKTMVLATVTGLKSGVAQSSDQQQVGINSKNANNETVFTAGLSETNGKITVSANVLGTTNVTLKPTAGFSYSLALDKGVTHAGGEVNTAKDKTKTFWYIQGKKLVLRTGTARSYALSNDKMSITETDEKVGNVVATVAGLKTGLKVVDGDIDGIKVTSGLVTVDKKVLNKADVTLTTSNNSGYVLKLASSDLAPQLGTYWDVKGTTATLNSGDLDGYIGDSSTKLTYKGLASRETLATITGLKSGLKVKDDYTIDGIVADAYNSSNARADKTITLSKNALGNTDVELDATGLGYGYSLKADDSVDGDNKPTATAVTMAEFDHGWREGTKAGKNGTAYYDVTTTTAGFAEVENDENKVYKLDYKARGTVTTTLTGLAFDPETKITETGGLSDPYENGVIEVSEASLGDKNVKLTNAKGGTYTLALDGDVSAPTISTFTWVPDARTKTKATLQGDVGEAGYELSADKTFIAYTPAGDGSTTTLATVTGLKSGLTSAELNAGIRRNGNELILTESVLGGTKLAVSGGNYTLALDSQVKRAAEETTNWVTGGTTATYKTYMCGYYTPDAKGTTINYTKPTAGTTYATLKGIKSGVDLNGANVLTGSTTGGTVKLTTDQLGTSKVTLTGKNFDLALDSTVRKEPKTELEWVVNGTTATYTKHVQTYYTISGNTITYHAPTKGTVQATVTGIKSGLENFQQYVNSNTGVITLGEDQLAQKAVKLTGDGYTLALGTISEDNLVKPIGTYWIQGKSATQADYYEDLTKGYALSADSKTITYSGKDTTVKLATLKGITNAEVSDVAYNGRTEVEAGTAEAKEFNSKYYTYDGAALSNSISVDGDTITVTAADFAVNARTGEIPNGAKVTLTTSYDYKLGALNKPAKTNEGNPEWRIVVNNRNVPTGQLVYQQGYGDGHTLSTDGKTLTFVKAKSETLATLSGLSGGANGKLATLDENSADHIISTTALATYGIAVNGSTFVLTKPTEDENFLFLNGKITLGKNDAYRLDASALAPEADGYKWTLKGTTATYSVNLTDGFKQTDTKNVAYTRAALGDTVFTLSGLKKGLRVGTNDEGKSIIGVLNGTTKKVEEGITVNAQDISLTEDVLGTTDVKITNGTGQNFVFNDHTYTKNPGDATKEWVYNKGTATYRSVQNMGYTLDDDKTTVKYTPASVTTLATVKGLNKTFTGYLEGAIKVDGETITVNKELLTASNVTLTLPRNAITTYSLAIGADAAQQANTNPTWITSGTNANFRDYTPEYYTIDPNSGAIVYHKPVSGTLYATVKGIKSGVDITSAAASAGTTGGTITLNASQLGTSSVSVAVPKNNSSAVYKLAIAKDVPTVAADVVEWVTAKGTATYRDYNKGSYNYDSTKNQIIYSAGTNPRGRIVDYATIKGAIADVTAVLDEDDGVFDVNSTELGKSIVIGSSRTDTTDPTNLSTEYGFRFTDSYSNAAIAGSGNNDTIIAAGSGLTITGGKGNDEITLGAGTRAGNLIVYSKGEGDDTIVNFQEVDKIQIRSGFNATTSYTGDNTITIPVNANTSGTITLDFADGTPDYITINNVKYSTSDGSVYTASSNVLLADDNYSMNAASLSDIVQPDSASFTPYDFDGGFSLTKEDKLTSQVSYSGKDK